MYTVYTVYTSEENGLQSEIEEHSSVYTDENRSVHSVHKLSPDSINEVPLCTPCTPDKNPVYTGNEQLEALPTEDSSSLCTPCTPEKHVLGNENAPEEEITRFKVGERVKYIGKDAPLFDISDGENLEVVEDCDEWVKVRTSNKKPISLLQADLELAEANELD